MIYLNKILPVFVLPLGVTLGLLIAGLIWRRRRWPIVAGVVLLWVSSTPMIGGALFRATEEWAVRIPASDAPTADAIVVLSGGRVTAPGAGISEWADPDRFFAGIELFELRKAKFLVFTGGVLPGAPDTLLEGDVLKQYALKMGVPEGQILTTGSVSNTAGEATAVWGLLHGGPGAAAPRILLVTSAFHMPRARQLFDAAGFSVAAFPVDFRGATGGLLNILNFVPSPGALSLTQTAIREAYGRMFYRVRALW